MKIHEENPNGLHQRYVIRKIIGIRRGDLDWTDRNGGNRGPDSFITKEVDLGSEYFVMRLDKGGKDKIHLNACRKAVLYYAELIKNHLPELSKDLIDKYSEEV